MVKHTKLKKRITTAALSAAMVASTVSPLLAPLAVNAAPSTGQLELTFYDSSVYSMDRANGDISSKSPKVYGDWFGCTVEKIAHTPEGNANFSDSAKFDVYRFEFVGTVGGKAAVMNMERIDDLAYWYHVSTIHDKSQNADGTYKDAEYAAYMALTTTKKSEITTYGQLAETIASNNYAVAASKSIIDQMNAGGMFLVPMDENCNMVQDDFNKLVTKYGGSSGSGYAYTATGSYQDPRTTASYTRIKPGKAGVWSDGSTNHGATIATDGDSTTMTINISDIGSEIGNGKDVAIFEDSSQYAKSSGYTPNNKTYSNPWSCIIQDFSSSTAYTLKYNDDLSSTGSAYKAIPVHDEVHRGGISFEIRDIDLMENGGSSQGDGDLSGDTDAIFAIYNISSVNGKYSSNLDPTGYIVPDRGYYKADGKWEAPDNEIDTLESTIFIPSYNPETIIEAYEKYLEDYSKFDTDVSKTDSFSLQHAKVYASYLAEVGLMTDIQAAGEGRDFACYTSLRKKYGTDLGVSYTAGSSNIEFNLGKHSTSTIIPAMVVEAKNGMIETGALSLPVGTYMILQVKAGEGYYIDEDFRPIITVGDWQGASAGSGTAYLTDYHTSHDFADTGAKANFDAATKSTFVSSVFDNKEKTEVGSVTYPVRYVGTYAGGSTAVTNVSSSTSNAYTIIGSGTVNSAANGENAGAFKYETPTDTVTTGKYTQNDLISLGVNEQSRLLKKSVTGATLNKFTAYNAIVRSGSAYLLADSDDVQVNNGGAKYDVNRAANGDLIIIPQGNGDLDGANFKIENKSKHMVANVNGGSAIGVNGFNIYTVENNKLVIPSNELAYGTYVVSQISAGDGYDKAGSENVTLASIDVKHEDKHGETFANNKGEVTERPVVNGTKYMTNELIAGGDLEMLHSKTAEGQKATIKIYNISDHYVYVDSNPVDGVDHTSAERRCSLQDLYEKDIKGQELTFEEINQLIENYSSDGLVAENALCLTREVTIGTDLKSATRVLPYGDYLMVITEIPEDYEVVGSPFVVDSIEKPSDDVIFEGKIEKKGTTPEIITTFTTAAWDENDSVPVADGVVMKDKLALQNLTPGQKYTVYGIIIDKETGEMVPGSTVAFNSGIKAYKPTSKTDVDLAGTAEAEILFDWINTSDMEGHTLVAYEYLCDYVATGNPLALKATSVENLEAILKSSMYAEHTSLIDEAQTAYVPTLDITAVASYSGGKTIDMTETVKATIDFGNIEAGNTYKITATLYDESDNVVLINDKEAVIETVIKAVNSKGSIDVIYKGLEPEKYNNQRLTVYATLTRFYNDVETKKAETVDLITKGDADSMGYDPTDEEPGQNQVDVLCPVIKTVLTSASGSKAANFEDKVSLVDTVTYSNLIVGEKYRAVLTLVDDDGFDVFDDDGNIITATVDFTAKTPQSKIEIPVSFTATNLIGTNVVAYNDLYKVTSAIKLVGFEHKVIADQMVKATSPSTGISIATIAIDGNTNTHYMGATGTGAITDKVTIHNLVPEKEYTLVTQVANAKTGAVIENIQEVQTLLKADEDGDIITKVTVPITGSYKGKTLVIYETLYDKNMKTVIAKEENNENRNQMIYVGSIDTVATAEDGSKTIPVSKAAVIMDTIEYTNLAPGIEYVIKSTTTAGGTTKTKFTPDNSKGSVTVRIELDTTGMEGKKITALEVIELESDGTKILAHEDESDLDQTVTVAGDPDADKTKDPSKDPNSDPTSGNPKTGAPNTSKGAPQTGIDQNWPIYLGSAFMMMLAALGVWFFGFKKKDE